MPQLLVKLYFKSPLRIGPDNGGTDLDDISSIFRSDQFYSAICNAMVDLFGNETLIDFFNTDIKITDLFPFIEENYYLPIPLCPPDQKNQSKQKHPLTRKNRPSLISIKDFNNYLKGEHDKMVSLEVASQGELTNNVEKDLFINNNPHVALKDVIKRENEKDRPSGEFYFVGNVVFPDNSGLWCIVEADEDNLNIIKACINYLGDEGIGGKRSWGYGHYTASFNDKIDILEDIEHKEGSKYLLSTLIPENPSDVCSSDFYELIPRKGYVYDMATATSNLKKTVYAFRSGSVFKNIIAGNPRVNVSSNDSKQCYRFGKEFFINIQVPNNE